MDETRRDRAILAFVVFAVLFSQLLLYPGIADLVTALGAEVGEDPLAAETAELDASMWFLTAEFGAYVAFVGLWGLLSDATGRRTPFVVTAALGGAACYLVLALLPAVDAPFRVALAVRVAQGATTIGAFSLTMTMLMDLEGGHGQNMGAAGIAIGLGAALGAPVGGQLSTVDPLAPLYAASGLLVIVALLALLVTDRAPSGRRRLSAIVDGLRRTPTLSIPYAFGFVDRFTAGFFALVGTLYFRHVFDLDPAATGLMLMLFFAPFALLQYPMGVLSDRFGRAIPIVGGSVCYGLGLIAVGVAPTLTIAGVAMVGVGVLGALVSPATMALVTDLTADTERGVAMAGFNLFGSVGFLAGFLVGGTVAGAYDYLSAFLVAGGLELLIALVAAPAFLRLRLGRVEATERARGSD